MRCPYCKEESFAKKKLLRDGWKITGSGLIIHNLYKDEYSEFNGWLDNSFVQLAVNYTF